MSPVVFITGASSGIGEAAARAFAAKGYQVAVTARRIDRLSELTDELTPEKCLAIAADVTDADATRAAVDQAVQRFGRIDVLVVNAGIGQRGGLVESSWDDLETVLRTNIDGALHTLRAAVPHMSDGGHIVIVSSVNAGAITPYTATYSASKAFVSSIAQALRYELEPRRITVTDLRVGRTATAFNQKRLGAQGYADSAGKIPVMPVEKVAQGVVRSVETRPRVMTLRPFDWVLMWLAIFFPKYVARQALKQYRPS